MHEKLPQPENYDNVVDFKSAVYDKIEEGVPSWIFDIKLSIEWKMEHGEDLTESEKILLDGEE